jgi:hypothetical protein
MKYGWNPRLINFGTEALAKIISLDRQSFLNWHSEFVCYVIANIFYTSCWSEFYNTLIGQSNLLLLASAFQGTADVLLHKHYANRALPDGSMFATRSGCS